MLKQALEKMKVNAITENDDDYEVVSVRLSCKNYAMFEVLSEVRSEPKISMLTSEISKMLAACIIDMPELHDDAEKIINTQLNTENSFIHELDKSGLITNDFN